MNEKVKNKSLGSNEGSAVDALEKRFHELKDAKDQELAAMKSSRVQDEEALEEAKRAVEKAYEDADIATYREAEMNLRECEMRISWRERREKALRDGETFPADEIRRMVAAAKEEMRAASMKRAEQLAPLYDEIMAIAGEHKREADHLNEILSGLMWLKHRKDHSVKWSYFDDVMSFYWALSRRSRYTNDDLDGYTPGSPDVNPFEAMIEGR